MIYDRNTVESIALRTSSGYWSVGDACFLHKAECLKYASSINNYQIEFHYYDQFYRKTVNDPEPKETLEELYKRRAQQLRDKYDFIAVAYSGGADSANVIDSFLDNGIPLDAIITSYPIQAIEKLKHTFDPRDKSASNLIFEFSEAAEPKLKEIAQKHPNVRIECLDHTTTSVDLLLGNKLHLIPVAGIGASPHLAGHYLIGQMMQKLSDKKNAVLVTGVDKPRIGYSPRFKKFGTYFDDITLVWGNHTDDVFEGFKPKTEHFYYSTDFSDIWLKQIHILKRSIEPLTSNYDNYKHLLIATMPNGDQIFNVHDIFFKKILYKQWSEFIFQAGKPSGYFFQEHSNWFFKTDLVSQRVKEYHKGQVLEFIHGVDPKLIVWDNDKPLKFVEMHSQILVIP